MRTNKDNSNAFLIHISAMVGYFFPMGGIIAPVIFWQVKKDESQFLDEHGKEAVNFNLSFFLYSFILGLTFIPLFIRNLMSIISQSDQMHNNFNFEFPFMFGFLGGITLLGTLSLIRFTLIILAASKASKGENYKYPFTIKFIK